MLKGFGIALQRNFTDNKIGVVYNPIVKNSSEVLDELMKILNSHEIKAQTYTIDAMQSEVDFVFVIGGDGTLLKAARFYAKNATPVFGINLGRLGFLSQAKEKELNEAINKIINNEFKIEDRIMLTSNEGLFALNDFVIKGPSSSRTSRFYLSINDKFVCDYLADGLIISTPTGSTAYGLSAGGPVLAPQLEAIVIVPICPHTLTARPLVIPSSEKISISTCDNCTSFVVVSDGQDSKTVYSKIEITKADKSAKLALLSETNFYSVLRDKLHWGLAPKN